MTEKFTYDAYKEAYNAIQDAGLKLYKCCGGKDTKEILEIKKELDAVKIKLSDLYNRDPERVAEAERINSDIIEARIKEGLEKGSIYQGEDGIYRYKTPTSNGYICENGVWKVAFLGL